MKNLIFSILALVAIGFFTSGLKNSSSENECSYNKDSMNVVMSPSLTAWSKICCEAGMMQS